MAVKKCSLSAVDGSSGLKVEALLNPKDLSVDKKVQWEPQPTKANDSPTIEFLHAQPKTLSVVLLFDTYEREEPLRATYIEPLETMSKPDPELGRPPKVLFQWGDFKFHGAIESLAVKYTMFTSEGTPCRADVTINMREAERLNVSGGSAGGTEQASEQQQAREQGRNADLSDETINDSGTVIPRGG